MFLSSCSVMRRLTFACKIERESALTYAMKYGRCGDKNVIQAQRHIAIRDERDQGLLLVATSKTQIRCL